MSRHWWAFWYALVFLTRIPAPYLKRTDDQVAATSLLYYPLVGLLIGSCLLALTLGTLLYNADANLLLLAAILVTATTLLSGALHLDGLADSADAWVGGLGDRERTLAIMKDPQSGPIGVAAVVLALLLQTAAMYALLDKASSTYLKNWDWLLLCGGLLLVPMLARAAAIGLLATTPYVRANGLASALVAGATAKRVLVIGGLLALLCGVLLQTQALFIIALWITISAAARQMMIARIDGCSGDTIGATIAVQEALLLAAIAL